MAVFTQVTEADATALLTRYDAGEFVSLQGITQGVENTNYILTTSTNKLILTLIERRVDASELVFFTSLLAHVNHDGIPCPSPSLPVDGLPVSLHGKPVLMVSFLDGQQHPTPTAADVAALGDAIGRMHQSLASFPSPRVNPIGPSAWLELLQRFGDRLAQFDADLPTHAQHITKHALEAWPSIPHHQLIHADAFTDNIFFDSEGKVSGIIDWYFTCTAPRAYELAVILCDWCFSKDHHTWLPAHAEALISSYQQHITLSPSELSALPSLCQAAALRFLLTRAEDMLFPRDDADVVMKDPQEYVAKLKFFMEHDQEQALCG